MFSPPASEGSRTWEKASSPRNRYRRDFAGGTPSPQRAGRDIGLTQRPTSRLRPRHDPQPDRPRCRAQQQEPTRRAAQVLPPTSLPDRPQTAPRYSRVIARRSGRAAPLRLRPLPPANLDPPPPLPPEPSEALLPPPHLMAPPRWPLMSRPRAPGPISGTRGADPAPRAGALRASCCASCRARVCGRGAGTVVRQPGLGGRAGAWTAAGSRLNWGHAAEQLLGPYRRLRRRYCLPRRGSASRASSRDGCMLMTLRGAPPGRHAVSLPGSRHPRAVAAEHC